MQEPGQNSELKELLASAERMLNAWEKRIPASEEDTIYIDYRENYNSLYREVNQSDQSGIDVTKLRQSLKDLKEAIKNHLLTDIQSLFENIDKLMSERVIGEPRRSEINSQLDAIRQKKGKISYIRSENPEMILGTLDALKNELYRYEKKEKSSKNLSGLLGVFASRKVSASDKGSVKSVVTDRNAAINIIKDTFANAGGKNPFKSTGIFNAFSRWISRTNHKINSVPIKYIVDYLIDRNTPVDHIRYILAERGRFDTGRNFLKELADNPKELERLIKGLSPEIRSMVHRNQIKLMTKARDRDNLRKIMDDEVRVDEIKGVLKEAEQLVNADLNSCTTQQLEEFIGGVNTTLSECRSVTGNSRKYPLSDILYSRFENAEKELLLSRVIALQILVDKNLDRGEHGRDFQGMLDSASEELSHFIKSGQSDEAPSQAPMSIAEKPSDEVPQSASSPSDIAKRVSISESSLEQSAAQDQPPKLHKWAKKEVRTDENISGNSDGPIPDQKKP